VTDFILTGTVVPRAARPVADLLTNPQFGVLGSVVKLDARNSSEPDRKPLTFNFSFLAVPIGSQVGNEGFRKLEEDGGQVSFSPDIVGQYVIGLSVSNGTLSSEQVSATVDIRAILVPHGRGLVPDGKWIWSFIRDVWTQVENKEMFETLWSALIQIVGTELLKTYQVDFNKSIKDIQDLYQRRWLSYEPRLPLDSDDLSVILGTNAAGRDANTGPLGDSGLAVVTAANELLVVQGTVRPNIVGKSLSIYYSQSQSNVGSYTIAALSSKKDAVKLSTQLPAPVSDIIADPASFTFSFQSKTWIGQGSLLGVLPGDAIVAPGVSSGAYRVLSILPATPTLNDFTIVVDRAPPSVGVGVVGKVYRPVGYTVPADEVVATDAISVPAASLSSSILPGRVIVVGTRCFTVLRAAVDQNQRVLVNSITVDAPVVVSGIVGSEWRLPHTLISKTINFETEGVAAGDLLVVAILDSSGKSVEIPLQVVGVDRNRLGFVLTNETVVAGEVPAIPFSTTASIANGLQIPNTVTTRDGVSFLTGDAKASSEAVQSIYFKNTYYDKVLPASTIFSVAGRSLRATPRAVIRNSNIPVDVSVASIPTLQEFIQQPQISEHGGKIFQVRNEQEYELDHKPIVLFENTHFVLDGEEAFKGTLTFRTGTNVVEADGGDFVDRGVAQGDSFIIDEPLSIAGTYPILSVVSRTQLLTTKIPTYVLSEFVQAKVRIKRVRSGKFIRLIPQLFTAKKPAPSRFWAEVSFFDNADNIERNFGLLVGLKKDDLANTSLSYSYRQAVAGLMYAYTRGAVVDKIRLGASILLGLPFTEHRGIIRSIEEDYRLGPDGKPIMGRILIEDVDDSGTALGTSRIYTYPIDEFSALAGVDTNPATSKTYVVGDFVEPYASLAKGVEVLDAKMMQTGARSAEALIQASHSARVRVNDNIFLPAEIRLVSDFLKKITPSYISTVLTETSEFFEQVEVLEKVRLKLGSLASSVSPYTDSAGLGLPSPLMFDYRTNRGIFPLTWGGDPMWIRRAGKDLTVTSANNITIPSAGLINPRNHESFEAPLCEPGDLLLILGGPNDGVYPIESMTDSDIIINEVIVHTLANESISDGSGLQVTVSPARTIPEVNRHFAILRPIKARICSGTGATSVSGSARVILSGAKLRTYGAGPGDVLIFDSEGAPTRHTICAVVEASPGAWDYVDVTPAPKVNKSGVKYSIYRPSLLKSPSEEQFEVEATSGGVAVLPQLFSALAEIGDEIEFNTEVLAGYSDISVEKFRCTILDPVNLVLNPSPPLDRTFKGRLIRRRPFAFDIPLVQDSVDASFLLRTHAHGGMVNWIPGKEIRFSDGAGMSPANPCFGLRPGDLLTLSFGGDGGALDALALDVGYGPGTFPIAAISDFYIMQLTVALPAAGLAYWKATRRL
jgi:hypothetical protein